MRAGSPVRVSGRGFRPGSNLGIGQCAAAVAVQDLITASCDLTEGHSLMADGQGRCTTSLQVHTTIGVGGRREVLCVGERCAVGVAPIETERVIAIGALPPWRTGTRPPQAPRLVLRVSTLVAADPARVVVRGAGFPPESRVPHSQCPGMPTGDGVDAGDCLYDFGVVAGSDERGQFAAEMQVFTRFQRSSGELIDCRHDDPACVVASRVAHAAGTDGFRALPARAAARDVGCSTA